MPAALQDEKGNIAQQRQGGCVSATTKHTASWTAPTNKCQVPNVGDVGWCVCVPHLCASVSISAPHLCACTKSMSKHCAQTQKNIGVARMRTHAQMHGHAANLAPAPPGTSEHPHECCRPDRPQLWLQRGVVAVACIHVFSLIGRTDPTTNAECGMPHMATHASRSSEAQPIMACNDVSSHLQAWAL